MTSDAKFEIWLGTGYGPANKTHGIPIVDALRQGYIAGYAEALRTAAEKIEVLVLSTSDEHQAGSQDAYLIIRALMEPTQ
jgi:hypothetical protein